jgi:hypothetical protein
MVESGMLSTDRGDDEVEIVLKTIMPTAAMYYHMAQGKNDRHFDRLDKTP